MKILIFFFNYFVFLGIRRVFTITQVILKYFPFSLASSSHVYWRSSLILHHRISDLSWRSSLILHPWISDLSWRSSLILHPWISALSWRSSLILYPRISDLLMYSSETQKTVEFIDDCYYLLTAIRSSGGHRPSTNPFKDSARLH